MRHCRVCDTQRSFGICRRSNCMAFVGKKSAPAKPRGTPPNPGIGLLDLITSLQSRVDAIRAGEPQVYLSCKLFLPSTDHYFSAHQFRLSYWRDEVNSGTPGPCEVCGKESIFRCILCQTALYCTKEHQTQVCAIRPLVPSCVIF